MCREQTTRCCAVRAPRHSARWFICGEGIVCGLTRSERTALFDELLRTLGVHRQTVPRTQPAGGVSVVYTAPRIGAMRGGGRGEWHTPSCQCARILQPHVFPTANGAARAVDSSARILQPHFPTANGAARAVTHTPSCRCAGTLQPHVFPTANGAARAVHSSARTLQPHFPTANGAARAVLPSTNEQRVAANATDRRN